MDFLTSTEGEQESDKGDINRTFWAFCLELGLLCVVEWGQLLLEKKVDDLHLK